MGVKNEMRARDWAVAIWATALFIGVMLLVTWPISPWSKWDWTGQTAAAWVQAVGSIAAILGTAGVMVWQHRLQVHAERTAKTVNELEVIDGLTKLFALAVQQASALEGYVEDAGGLKRYADETYPYEDFESLLEALRLSSIEDIKNPGLVLAFLAGRKAYDTFCSELVSSLRMGGSESSRAVMKIRLRKLLPKLESSRSQFSHRREVLRRLVS